MVANIKKQENNPWDIIIGGATWIGTVFDVASDGYRILFLEQYDISYR